MLGKIAGVIKKIASALDGNKTIICQILLLIVQIPSVRAELGGTYISVRGILFLLAGGSFAHHIKKGAFKRNEK